MREKELRLALVCYGGISLAIYMHGVTKEIHKLVRASRAYHIEPDQERRRELCYTDAVAQNSRECDSEIVYFELLQALADDLSLRVVVDTVAGTSAGGINGIMLARAIAHDLDLDHQRDMWLRDADVDGLMTKDKSKGFAKWLFGPLIRLFARYKLGQRYMRAEFLNKLAMLLRIRRLKPPFSGPHMLDLMYRAVADMGEPPAPEASLMPSGQALELFVNLTDFFGYRQFIPLHDPPVVVEREHKHTLKFTYRRWRGGEVIDDFGPGDIPGLAFAARATSSFPGAFPPTQLRDVDNLMAEQGRAWAKRGGFIRRQFKRYMAAGMDPDLTSFIDGSVLNNKPFDDAVQSISSRPAYREVDRRLVYIDPHPREAGPPPSGRVPGLLRTLKGALSDLPRNEPIHNDLAWIREFNEQMRRTKAVVDATAPHVDQLVAGLSDGSVMPGASAEQIGHWRKAASTQAARDAGYAYQGYARLKIAGVLDYLSRIVAGQCGIEYDKIGGRFVHGVLEDWARRRDILPGKGVLPPTGRVGPGEDMPAWVFFLLRFDVEFRRRRVRLVIQRINLLYGRLGEDAFKSVTPEMLNELKAGFYETLGELRKYDNGDFLDGDLSAELRALFGGALPEAPEGRMAETSDFVDAHGEAMDRFIEGVAEHIDLISTNEGLDRLLAGMDPAKWGDTASHELLVDYLGFAFWDVMTFGVTQWRDLGEFNEILVDRISPNDANTLSPGVGHTPLRGVALDHFGAFFSRGDRENDYLWGRLHGAERMIDIVADAARQSGAGVDLDVMDFKKRAFRAILETEAKHLPECASLIVALDVEIAKL